ncbi:MAG: SDR family oxidoreductase, partial [Deltaproteobacteria bacterium]|nr:SDR family oxidoreductase [Deltaproteobacteria bacterium]
MASTLSALFDLSGRSAIVTGGSRGIGRAIAKGLAEAGAAVVVAARNGEACEAVAEEIRADGGRAAAVSFDLSSPDTSSPVIDAAIEHFGRLDVLINNGAILKPHLIAKLTAEEMDLLHATNVRGPVLLSQLAFPHLRAGGGGSIVNLGAVAGHSPMKGLGAYGASKAAMINWTRVMAQEWTPRGVRVNGLTPGSVATDMILPEDPAKRALFVEDMASQNLFGRIAEPEEMVGTALFLASDASSFMTGQILVVDG